ncbi:hypothetical protein Esti_000310 [Eimeria stiedai]
MASLGPPGAPGQPHAAAHANLERLKFSAVVRLVAATATATEREQQQQQQQPQNESSSSNSSSSNSSSKTGEPSWSAWDSSGSDAAAAVCAAVCFHGGCGGAAAAAAADGDHLLPAGTKCFSFLQRSQVHEGNSTAVQPTYKETVVAQHHERKSAFLPCSSVSAFPPSGVLFPFTVGRGNPREIPKERGAAASPLSLQPCAFASVSGWLFGPSSLRPLVVTERVSFFLAYGRCGFCTYLFRGKKQRQQQRQRQQLQQIQKQQQQQQRQLQQVQQQQQQQVQQRKPQQSSRCRGGGCSSSSSGVDSDAGCAMSTLGPPSF